VEALKTGFKAQIAKSLEEILRLARRVGTNHRISSKQVRFEFSKPYRSAASLLALRAKHPSDNLSSHGDENFQKTTKV